MKGTFLSSTFHITDTRVAAAFANPLRRRLILLAAGQERSLADLSEALDYDLKRLHYHVGELRKLGLLVVARTRPRAGRAIKMYRARAKAFFVADQVATSTAGNALASELRNLLANTHDRSRQGMLYFLGESGEPQMRPIQSAGAKTAASGEQWRVLQLSQGDAQRLAKDIGDCLKSFARRDSAGAKTYLVHFALAPRLLPGTRSIDRKKEK